MSLNDFISIDREEIVNNLQLTFSFINLEIKCKKN